MPRVGESAVARASTMFELRDGVPIGSHKVGISATEAPDPARTEHPGMASDPNVNYMSGKSLIPTRYNDPSTSGLIAEFKRGPNLLKFELTSGGE